MADYIFTMHQVSRVHPPDKEVLKNISLNFLPGAKIGILGPNGAGKSSLLKIMAGTDTDFKGEARLRDRHRQLGSADLGVHRHREHPGFGERIPGLLDLGDHRDGGAVERRLIGVTQLVVVGEVPGGQLFAEIQGAGERLGGVVGEARAFRQGRHIEPFE